MMDTLRMSWVNAFLLRGLREKTARNKRLFSMSLSLVLIAVLFANSSTANSFLVGIFAFSFYLFLNGKMLGRTFFGEEDDLFRLVFGLFLFIILMALMGISVQIIFPHELWYLFGMLLATIATFVLSHFLGFDGSQKWSNEKKSSLFEGWNPAYIFYFVLIFLSFFILFRARSGWIEGPIWNVLPPMFLQVYFIATAVLAVVILLPGKAKLKLLCVVLHSAFSLSFLIIVLYPGILYYDPWFTLAKSQESAMSVYARGMQEYFDSPFSVRALNTLLKGRICYALVVAFAEVLCVDRYWSTALLVPILWGVFAPLTSYKITQKIGGSKRTSILAGFLTIPNLYFLAWGKITAAASLGYLFFLPFVYFLLRVMSSSKTLSVRWIFSSSGVKTYSPLLIAFASLVTLHFLPMVMAFSFVVLAFALKEYKHIQPRFAGSLMLFTSFILSAFILPVAVIGRGILIPDLGTCAFSIGKLLDTSLWTLVFGMSEEFPVQDALLENISVLLGLIGFVYALQRKELFNKTLCFFLFLTFAVCLIDYRIFEYAIGGVRLFGSARVNVFREIVAVPFAGVAIITGAESLFRSTSRIRPRFRWRNILAGALVCISLSAWTTATIYETYQFYTRGLLPTSLEVEAVKFIDENTNGRYVVLAPHRTTMIGYGLLGYPNFEKMYYSIGRLGAPSDPSVEGMVDLMRMTDAEVGYFVASFRLSDFDETVAEALKIFGLFGILKNENGEIYIFNYKIPPLPQNSDVMAFYWNTPPSYYVQNDLVRIIVNPTAKTFCLRDFWGDLYESIDLNKTLVDGNPVGKLTYVQYFDSTNNKWIEWDPNAEIPPAEQFKFRLGFQEDSLVVLLERGKPFVDLVWESGRAYTSSLEMRGFTRIYIPGLISGEGSYDTNSREFGFLYTTVLTDNVTLQPAYGTNGNSSSLTFNDIEKYCGFTLENYMWYDVYVHNNANVDQWAFIEVWLPDTVYVGTFPPFSYSVDDGKTWVRPRFNVETGGPEPVRTLGGADVNWLVTKPRMPWEEPEPWWAYTKADGGYPELVRNYTDSGGAQNRIFFAVYLPARDKTLLRLGCAVYYVRPLKVSYVFRNSNNVYYGLHNMEEGLVKFYNLGTNEYVGSLKATQKPTSVVVVQDENGKINNIYVTLPTNTSLSLGGEKGVNTTQDLDGDGVPDSIG